MGDEYADVYVPFEDFTMEWNAKDGQAIETCADNRDYCPNEEALKDPRPIMVYAKGETGTFDLRIKTISAYGCDPEKLAELAEADAERGEDEIVVEDFSRPGGPINEWMANSRDENMSKSSVDGSVEMMRGVAARLTGGVGATMSTGKSGWFSKGSPAAFPDLSTCDGFRVEGRSMTDYDGYYLGFGPERHGYKAKIGGLPCNDKGDEATAAHSPKWTGSSRGGDFGTVDLPFASFDSEEPKARKCSEDDPRYCPSLETLKNIRTMSLWGEDSKGGGKVLLDVRRITAFGCADNEYARMMASVLPGGTTASDVPGVPVIVLAVLLAGIFGLAQRKWKEWREAPSRGGDSSYGEVPPITADAEVSVLRSELVEMRKKVSALGGKSAGGGTEFDVL